MPILQSLAFHKQVRIISCPAKFRIMQYEQTLNLRINNSKIRGESG